MTDILTTDGLTKQFGTLTAVSDVSLSIPRGQITSVIGPNGAGKTTLFNLITGKHPPTAGEITFNDTPIAGREPHEIARMGVVRSFQINNFFPELTALENVRLATQARHTGFSPRDFISHHTTLEKAMDDAYAILDRVGLTDVANQPAADLSHGQRRNLEIGISLACDPDLLLMDEPTAGMSPEETEQTVDLIKGIANDLTLVLIEHDMDIVMNISDNIAVMNKGQLLSYGSPNKVSSDKRVQKAYFGGGTA
ncbi:ABC transporter ATP-binding protein [Natrialbaceae archaeon A-gly3]